MVVTNTVDRVHDSATGSREQSGSFGISWTGDFGENP